VKTQYGHIHFVKKEDRPKNAVWSCRNNRSSDQLGVVKWYSAWMQYCYFPTVQAVYSVGCLEDINDFIGQLKKLKEVKDA